jgi:hypothetical protein
MIGALLSQLGPGKARAAQFGYSNSVTSNTAAGASIQHVLTGPSTLRLPSTGEI